MAMHDCDVMLCVGARFDDRITGRTDAFSPGSKKIHIDIDPSSINKNIRVDIPIIGDAGNVLGDLLQVFKAEAKKPDIKPWWQRDREMARAQFAVLQEEQRYHPAAIRDPAAVRGDPRPRHLHHDRSRPAPDVGGAVLRLRGAAPLDDLGRSRHHGLRPAGGDRRPGRASRQPRDRHRRRCLGADDDAGDVDGGSVRTADQDIHPEQPVYGHGAAVAAVAARQPAVAQLFRSAAGFRQARRGLSAASASRRSSPAISTARSRR